MLSSLSLSLAGDPEGTSLTVWSQAVSTALRQDHKQLGISPPSSRCLYIWRGFGIWRERPVY